MILTAFTTEHGGEVNYKYRFTSNYVLTKYGRPSYYLRYRTSTSSHSGAPSPSTSRPLSRISSFESMRETFYSAAGTPRSLSAQSPSVSQANLQGYRQKHPTWLDMTLTATPVASNSLPKLNANGLQLASPMMSPKQTSSSMPTSAIRYPRDTQVQESLEERYYEYEESEASVDGEYDDTWDQESLASDASKSGDLPAVYSGRQSRSVDARIGSAITPDINRESSLARLRTQLTENDTGHAPPLRGRSSGTLVSHTII